MQGFNFKNCSIQNGTISLSNLGHLYCQKKIRKSLWITFRKNDNFPNLSDSSNKDPDNNNNTQTTIHIVPKVSLYNG